MLAETRDALAKALAFIEKLEWSTYERCPSCGGYNPGNNRPAEWHGRFGHSEDCELGQILGKKLHQFSCDCYVPGKRGCTDRPKYNGKTWAKLSDPEKQKLILGPYYEEGNVK